MQFFAAADVARLAPYGPLIDALALGLSTQIESPSRSHFHPNQDASAVLIMPAWRPHQIMGTKIVSIWPDNHLRGQSAVSAVYVVTSCKDGTPLAVIDGTELTLRRTAAAAALSARILARPDSRRLLVLGTGALSAPLVLAHRSAFAFSDISIWGRSMDKAHAVVQALAKKGVIAQVAADLEQAVAQADIVAAATTATAPFLRDAWVRPGTHVGLIGAFSAGMAEAEPRLIARSALFADNRAAVLEKGGEVVQALLAGLISERHLRAELSELLAVSGAAPGRQSAAEITVFKSVGFAALDLIAAEHVLAAAQDDAAAA